MNFVKTITGAGQFTYQTIDSTTIYCATPACSAFVTVNVAVCPGLLATAGLVYGHACGSCDSPFVSAAVGKIDPSVAGKDTVPVDELVSLSSVDVSAELEGVEEGIVVVVKVVEDGEDEDVDEGWDEGVDEGWDEDVESVVVRAETVVLGVSE